MHLNHDIVNTEKSDGIHSLTLAVDELFLVVDYSYIHQSFLLNIQDLHK